MDQTDRNLSPLRNTSSSMRSSEPHRANLGAYNCQSWSQEPSIEAYRDMFHPHQLPFAQQLEGDNHAIASLRSLIQECRELIFMQSQLQQLSPDRIPLFQSVYAWIETRHHVLTATSISTYDELSKQEQRIWPCLVIGVICALNFLFYSRSDPSQLHNVDFRNLGSHMENLFTSLNQARAHEYSTIFIWMSFIGACGEQALNTGPGKINGWFTMHFDRLLATAPSRGSIEVKGLLKQFLYDEELQEPLLMLLMQEEQEQSWIKRGINAKFQELKASAGTENQSSATSQSAPTSRSTTPRPPRSGTHVYLDDTDQA